MMKLLVTNTHFLPSYVIILALRAQAKKMLPPCHINKRISVAAWLITGKRVRTKYNKAMQFLTFEDETGILETTFFPKAYAVTLLTTADRFC